MKRTGILAIAASLVALPVLAETAPTDSPYGKRVDCFGEQGHEGWKEKGHFKKGKFSKHGDQMMKLFGELDTDKDGKLTEAEISAGAALIIKTLDANGDGALSKDDKRMGKRDKPVDLPLDAPDAEKDTTAVDTSPEEVPEGEMDATVIDTMPEGARELPVPETIIPPEAEKTPDTQPSN